jgi:ABC-type molybdate transport system permease subunit
MATLVIVALFGLPFILPPLVIAVLAIVRWWRSRRSP